MAEGGLSYDLDPRLEAEQLLIDIDALLTDPLVKSTIKSHHQASSNMLHHPPDTTVHKYPMHSSPPLQQSDLQTNTAPQNVDLNITLNTLINKLDQVLALQPDQQTISQTKSSDRKERVVLPEVFKGGPSDDWQDYISMFEMYAKINNWDPREQALYLATRMRGEAQRIVTDLTDSDRTDFKKLKAALSKRFCPEEKASLMQVEFKNRKRKKGEELSDLLLDLKRLARLAYPKYKGGILEQLVGDKFLEVLENREWKRHIHLNRITMLDKILAVSLEYEAFDDAENANKVKKIGSVTVNKASETQGIEKKLDRLTDLTDQLYRQMGVLTGKFSKLLDNNNDDRPEFLGIPQGQTGDTDNHQPSFRGRGRFRRPGAPRDRALSRGRGNFRGYMSQQQQEN